MKPDLLYFVETSVFRKQIDKLANVETLFELQNELLKNPRLGDVFRVAAEHARRESATVVPGAAKAAVFDIFMFIWKSPA